MATIEEITQKLVDAGFQQVFEGKLISDGKDVVVNNMLLKNIVKIYLFDNEIYLHSHDKSSMNNITQIIKLLPQELNINHFNVLN